MYLFVCLFIHKCILGIFLQCSDNTKAKNIIHYIRFTLHSLRLPSMCFFAAQHIQKNMSSDEQERPCPDETGKAEY